MPKATTADHMMHVVALGPFYGALDTSMEESAAQDFIGVFGDAMAGRLEAAGVSIVDGGDSPNIELSVRHIMVGFDAASWIGEVAYDATVTEHGEVVCTESIRDRARAMNWAGADSGQKALNEAFTNAINKFDLNRCLGHLGNTSP